MASVKTVTGAAGIIERNLVELRTLNPVIPVGVIVKVIDNPEMFIGDGVTSFNNLRPIIGNVRFAGKGTKIYNGNIGSI